MNAIFKRKSIRSFQNKEVENDKIEMLLRAAMAAPSSGNQQPWEFFVIRNKQLLEEISTSGQYSNCVKDAPFAIVPCYRKTNLRFEKSVHLDMSASVENILLEAVNQELGAVWIGVAPAQDKMDAVKKALKLGDDVDPFAIIACGYPVSEYEQQDRFDDSRIHYCE